MWKERDNPKILSSNFYMRAVVCIGTHIPQTYTTQEINLKVEPNSVEFEVTLVYKRSARPASKTLHQKQTSKQKYLNVGAEHIKEHL